MLAPIITALKNWNILFLKIKHIAYIYPHALYVVAEEQPHEQVQVLLECIPPFKKECLEPIIKSQKRHPVK